ncbi:MAG: multicopper oxidase domain-containing protein [Verrucomicrobia bacterium]|nr:multicopper oxidase domain-containing protein [Verrucomicrobiota bacterium]
MKITKYSISLLVISLLFAACGDSSSDPAGNGNGSAAAEPPAPADPVSVVDGVTVVEMTGNDRMKYNVDSFTVSAGSPVKVIFTNVGKMPKAAMGHNVVFLTADADANAFAAAATSAKDNDYIPEQLNDQILIATELLGPGEKDTIEFTAPDTPGEYAFICSFPAHLYAGMRGVMIVE